MIIDALLIGVIIISAIWTAMSSRLLRSGIALAVTSALIAVAIYRMNSPIAAIFELSVCAGLIPVIFITTISFTHRLTQGEVKARQRHRIAKYWFLPAMAIIAGVVLALKKIGIDATAPVNTNPANFGQVMWGERHLDLVGQIAVLLTGALGVAVFFKKATSKAGKEDK